MAIVEFVNKPNRTYVGMRAVINYVVQIHIYDGDKLWWPEGLGPFWIKHIDTMFARHTVFHELRRVKSE